MINYGKQTLKENDIKSVVKILKTPFLTSGPYIEKFEKELIKNLVETFAQL